ncbi:hypothetical protein B296_00035669 [Ensete ventricosum]|uniref:protein-serine/threonine phosphatase n=1 Tax=Ensete ventricosum TaxID=4639 RepID=A0A426XT11_ENSVE|nr:hypothetical protein B296_00035669 [Ensete ventricosum]
MAEICCDVVTKAEPLAAPCSRSPPADRPRRMGRRFKFVAGAEALALTKEMDGKRQRFGCPRSVPGLEVAERPRLEVVPQRASDPELSHLWPPKYGIMAVCGRRREMEDAVSIRPNFVGRACGAAARNLNFFGVYDGHGCSHVRLSLSLSLRISMAFCLELLWAHGFPFVRAGGGVVQRSDARVGG